MSLTDLDNLKPASGSRQAALIAFQIIFVSVSLLVYSLRAFTRAVILRSIGSDDYIMGFAMVRPFSTLFFTAPRGQPASSLSVRTQLTLRFV
jgi:hypothetical protein